MKYKDYFETVHSRKPAEQAYHLFCYRNHFHTLTRHFVLPNSYCISTKNIIKHEEKWDGICIPREKQMNKEKPGKNYVQQSKLPVLMGKRAKGIPLIQ